MDAQNVVESNATKPASTVASPRTTHSAVSESTHKSSTPVSTVTKSPPPASAPASKPLVKEKESKSGGGGVAAAVQPVQDDDAHSSEAETIVLADGSPQKAKKVVKREDVKREDIKREDMSDEDRTRADTPGGKKSYDGKSDGHVPRDASSSGGGLLEATKRKRLADHQPRSKDSSGLSSVPASPLNHIRQRSVDGRRGSDSESAHAKSVKPIPKDVREKDPKDKDAHKARSENRQVSQKRKTPRADSDDEAELESHKARRQKTSNFTDASNTPHRHAQKERDHPKLSAKLSHEPPLGHRSTSPHPRLHRRSASTQVVSQSGSGLSQKKKRIPPPLATDYNSDESSASGSPHIRSSTLRGLTTPVTAESTMSTKNPAHKKHVDAHGQTQLAKACSRGEYDNVKKRLQERPQDLNFPDYAGNTPLQIAAINGFDDIVKLLVEAGCDIDCVNHDKDTPLLDAVDNGHLDVIKVLLDAGVNPRKANVNGEEPLDRVDDDLDNADEIREALAEARKKVSDRRRTSEEQPDHPDSRSSHGPESPRRSPAIAEPIGGSRRAASSRYQKLPNHLLYMHMDDKTLRAAAGKGDVETVERILQVRDNFDDPESMVAAARGGHETVLNLLLALGNANPDPPPVSGLNREVATPILAAIGQENIRVIQLLLAQSSFDPTKKFRGEAYHEIARRRQGPNWKEEEHILRDAYDAYRKSHRDSTKKSPNRKDQDGKRSGRTETRDDVTKPAKRKASSPGREEQRTVVKPRLIEKESKNSREQGSRTEELTSPKRGPGRPKKEDRGLPAIAISDGENSPPSTKSSSKSKRPDPELAAMSSEGEAKPRKRLMSGKDLKEQERKNRRASNVSNPPSMREPSSPRDTRQDDSHDRPFEKYHDRAKALKRDESRDRLSVSGEHSVKRSRASATPDHGASEKEGEPVKRRRLDVDSKKEKLPKVSSSPDRNRKTAASRDTPSSSAKADEKSARKLGDSAKDTSRPRKSDTTTDPARREAREHGKSVPPEKSIHVKSEDADVVMRDADQVHDEESKARAKEAKEAEKKRRADIDARKKEKERERDREREREREREAAREKEREREREAEERKRREAEERKRREEEERRQALAQTETKKREEEEKEKRRLEEEERKKREEEARKKREEAERLRTEKEEAEQRRIEEEKIRQAKEEEERQKRAEEERIRKEKEAAEEDRRRREEEERREQERRAREEQRRAQREAEQRRLREEQERKRLERLPAFLRWLDRSTDAKTPDTAKRWRFLRGVRFDSIRPGTAGTSEGREQWVLNTQVAMLLGESDLKLTRFSGWERVPASEPAKYLVLGLAKPKPALTGRDEWDLGKQIPGYYFGKEPGQLTSQEKRQLDEESRDKFLALDSFFVKVCVFSYCVRPP